MKTAHVSKWSRNCFNFESLKILEIINKTLVVSNKPRKNIEAELEDSKRTGGAYIRVEGTYDHLLGMPIYTLTKEKVDELIK